MAEQKKEEIKTLSDTLEVQLNNLLLERDESHNILNTSNVLELTDQITLYRETLNKCKQTQREIRKKKLEMKDSMEEIKKWEEEVTLRRRKEEHIYQEMLKALEKFKLEEDQKDETKKKEEHKRNLELEKMKMETKLKSREVKPDNEKIRLPKLVISKFQGTHIDWWRFWNQFEAEIDKSSINQVTKFSYLKELLVPKVRLLIDGLPFTSEGYTRAKAILETKYGQTSEVVNDHIHQIIELPVIQGTNPRKVYEFYEKLVSSVQALETMGKLIEIKGHVRITLDKLPHVRPQLVQLDDDWKKWGFPEFVEALRKWTERNPPNETKTFLDDKSHFGDRRNDKLLQTKSFDKSQKTCVYCNSVSHKSLECTKVPDVAGRKTVLKTKRLCFNCASGRHRAAECTSVGKCRKCGQRHHTSICDTEQSESLFINKETNVVYQVVVVTVNGLLCRALLDTGAGSSYASATLIKKAGLKPIRTERKCFQMMLHTTTKNVDVYKTELKSKDKNFSMVFEMNKVDNDVLLTVPNPQYQNLINRYSHLQGIQMLDNDNKSELPIHLVLGAAEYSKIKTPTKPRIGKPGEPVAELTKCGWTILSPGKDFDLHKLYLTHNPVCDYEELCKLDVLGLEDQPEGAKDLLTTFKEQLGKTQEGRYETNIMWKSSKKPLRNNKNGSLARLHNLLKKLENDPKLFSTYDEIIQNQIREGIVEKCTEPPGEVEFYLPHKPVVRESAESTKVRVVYDASAKENENSASLNDCVETGPPLQNMLFDVILRNRFRPVCLSGDMRQAFLQICIRKEDRDALRFHWVENKDPNKIVTYRFTRAIFGLGESPFLLGGTIKEHLDRMRLSHPEMLNEIDQIENDLYVDDLISGGVNVSNVKRLKEIVIQLFGEARIELHKWHSNEPSLEEPEVHSTQDETYAKQQLGLQGSKSKILGMHWDKSTDEISVVIPNKDITFTKRDLLKFIASVYDPIGIISPTMLTGKMLFRDCCELGLSWDEKLPKDLHNRTVKWLKKLPEKVTVPRCIPQNREEIEAVELHAFGDASKQGVSAAVYAVVHQKNGTYQGLLTSKSRLASKGLTLPRLELTSCNMAANLLDNARSALKEFPVKQCTAWTDNTASLHWIRSDKEYKSYVNNRVRKIRSKEQIQWRYVPTKSNPADLGTRGCHGDELVNEWFAGPDWLVDESLWPQDINTVESKESESEAKAVKEILATTTTNECESSKATQQIYQNLMIKFKFHKTVRILAWVTRFIKNCRMKDTKLRGPLLTDEINFEIETIIKKEQEIFKSDKHFIDHKLRLNLIENDNGILECRGRVQGDYPVFIPPNTVLAEKLCEDSHHRTLHGGVTAVMADVRSNYWIPKLRQLVKREVRKCYWCKRFGAGALTYPGPSNLPKDRTEGTVAFQVIGTDFAGPIVYLSENRKERKGYILLFACSLSRAVHLELLRNQTADEFIHCLKKFIARRGRPNKIYSDNAQSYKSAAKWLHDVMKSEQLHNFLATNTIKWQFNLSRAPWWGGQFERIIGLVKQSLYKTIGRANLKWKELEEIILDIEVTLNNRPLSYMEDDIQYPVLTPNSLIHGLPTFKLLEDDVDSLEDVGLRKRAKYIQQCKQRFWTRWQNEYLRSLRERHTNHCKHESVKVKEGDVVIIKGDEKNRGKWKLGIVHKLFPGRDGVVRGVRLRAGKAFLDRAVQHLYPMELQTNQQEVDGQAEINNNDGQAEINNNDGQAEINNNDGQAEMNNNDGQDEMNNNDGQAETNNTDGQAETNNNEVTDVNSEIRKRTSRRAAANARMKTKIIIEDEEDDNDIAW